MSGSSREQPQPQPALCFLRDGAQGPELLIKPSLESAEKFVYPLSPAQLDWMLVFAAVRIARSRELRRAEALKR